MNEYIPFLSEVKDVIKHTELEYTFRMAYQGNVKPGQFFEVSLPKFGEAPISVSGIAADTIDFTIRKVGKVTEEIFENYVGDHLFLRGPYGNGFSVADYQGKELIIVAGGTGVSPVKGMIDHFALHPDQAKRVTVIAGFKSPKDMLFIEEQKLWAKNLNYILTVDNDLGQEGYRTGLVTKYIPDIPIDDLRNTEGIVVGPPIMMKFAVQELKKHGLADDQIWVSHERKMCCGIGKCGHCKIDDTYICLDGPVFRYDKGRELLD
jgi:anaerobic sulfite reductase subunit B